MGLTRPKIWDMDTNVEYFMDPITVLHQGATAANVDVGFLFNRANGLVSNVAIYWSEANQSFITAFTSNSGTTDSNISPSGYANLTIGNLITVQGSIIGVVGNVSFGNANITSTTTSTSTTSGALTVAGGTGISGNLYVGGNLNVAGTVTFQNSSVVTTTETVLGVEVVAGNLVANSGADSTSVTTGALVVKGGTGISGNVTMGANVTIAGTLTAGSLNVAGGGLNGVAIGQSTPAVATFTTANAITYYGNISPTTGQNTIYATGHIVPTANVAYDLGNINNRFRSLYLSGSTIYLGNAVITTSTTGDVVFNTTGSFAVPVGSTTQRSQIQGAMRYNTTLNKFESYDGYNWNTLAYGNFSDFPSDDYGDLTSSVRDAFGVKTVQGFDCGSDGQISTVDLENVGNTPASPI